MTSFKPVAICSTSNMQDAPHCDVVALSWRGEENEVKASKDAMQEALKWPCKKILWNLDLAFKNKENAMEDEILFHSRRVLIEYFEKTCLMQEGIETFGVCFYEGGVDFEKRLFWSENIENHYLELLKERKLETSLHLNLWKRGYALEILAEYLHKLGSYLPDEIPLFCSLDASLLQSPAEVLYLLSKERFQHLQLILKGCALPINSYAKDFGHGSKGGWDLPKAHPLQKDAKIAFVSPALEAWDDEIVLEVNQIISKMEECKTSYCIVNETTLTEEWEGIETLVVLANAITPTCKRKLQGYLASGGEVILYRDEKESSCIVPDGILAGLPYRDFFEWLER